MTVGQGINVGTVQKPMPLPVTRAEACAAIVLHLVDEVGLEALQEALQRNNLDLVNLVKVQDSSHVS